MDIETAATDDGRQVTVDDGEDGIAIALAHGPEAVRHLIAVMRITNPRQSQQRVMAAKAIAQLAYPDLGEAKVRQLVEDRLKQLIAEAEAARAKQIGEK